MYLPEVTRHKAATLQEAAEMMRRYAPEARLFAGGTDLLVDLKTRRARFRHIISINQIHALRGISLKDGALKIGALTTITQLGGAPIVRERCAPLLDTTRAMAAPQIRNLATVGGNIASAVPCADLPPILMVLGASVMLWSPGGERSVPMEAFFIGPRQTVVQEDEVLVAVVVPELPMRFGAAYARFALRDGNAIAVASVAAGVRLDEDNHMHDGRIALGAVAPTPRLIQSAGDGLGGRPPDDAAFSDAAAAATKEAEPISDVRGTAEYRRELVGILTRRALETACRRAREVAA